MAISLPTEQLLRSRDASALIVVNAESRQPFREARRMASLNSSFLVTPTHLATERPARKTRQ
jgi:hypothetical protein